MAQEKETKGRHKTPQDASRTPYEERGDGVEATALPGTDDPQAPFWSPDSRSLGFGSQGKLKRIELEGGRPQTLCDAQRLEGGTWNRAGVILFAPTRNGGLFQVPATGGAAQPVTSLAEREGGHINPCFLPDGRHFLYKVFGKNREQWVFVGSLDAKEVKLLLTDAAPAVYAPPGWLLFVRNGALVAQAFDTSRLELKGDPFSITQPTNVSYALGAPISVSENGVLIWQGDSTRNYQLVWFDRAGNQSGSIGSARKVSAGETPLLAPDGKRVALARFDPQMREDIWIIDVARNLPSRLTSDPSGEFDPIWSPDGSSVVFTGVRGGVFGIYQKAANGLGAEELLLKGRIYATNWSADGRFIITRLAAEKTRQDVWALPLFGDRQPYPLLNSEFEEIHPQLSSDGRWLAYASDESGSFEIYVQAFTADGKLGNDKKRLSTNGGRQPRFRGDGRELFYVDDNGQMMVVVLKPSGATFEFEPPKALFKTRMFTGLIQSWLDYDVTADGQQFLIGTLVGDASPVSVILNWTAGLKK